MTQAQLEEVQKAVEALGYIGKKSSVEPLGLDRCEVYVGGTNIGIYDFQRHTFVN